MSTIAATARQVEVVNADVGRVAPADAGRLAEIVITFARHGVDIAARRGAYLARSPQNRLPRALAVAIRKSFADLGPTFLKLGQFIASSPGLFPETLSQECRCLLQNVPPEPAEKARRVVESSLGLPIDVLFIDFDDEPVAAASIAQVHRAVLHDGRVVAVKVRRPRLAPRIEQDLRLLGLLASGFQRIGALGDATNPRAIVEDFAQTLRGELDFTNEAAAMVEFEANLRASDGRNDGVVVPSPIEGMVTERVLVMTFIDGTPVADIEPPTDDASGYEAMVRIGARAWFEGVVRYGFFHGDVHAGNLFLTTDNKVAFLDFGIMGRLSPQTRDVLQSAILAIITRSNFENVIEAMFALDAATGPIDADAVMADVEELVAPILEKPLAEIEYSDVITKLLVLATRYRVRLPSELVLVAKQLVYFERYSKELAPNYQILADHELWQV